MVRTAARPLRGVTLAVTFAISLLTLGGAASLIVNSLIREPGNSGYSPIPQSSTAEQHGIRLVAVDATISGTETLVRVQVKLTSEFVDGKVKADDIEGIVVPPRSVRTVGFASGDAHSGMLDGRTLVIELPPVVTDSSPTFTLTRLEVRTAAGRFTMDGEWQLSLSLPSPDLLQDLLKVETGPVAEAADRGIRITGSVVRSTSRTVLIYELPPGLVELAPPRLVTAEQTRVLPSSVGSTGGATRAVFQSTAFGSSVSFEFGPFASSPGAGNAFARIDLAAVLARAGSARPTTAVNVWPEDAVAGDAQLVVAAEFGRHSDGRSWFALTLRGNWPTEAQYVDARVETSWKIFDGTGMPLEVSGWEEHFVKDAGGNVWPGETKLSVFIDDSTNLDSVLVTVGGRREIVRGTWRLEFWP